MNMSVKTYVTLIICLSLSLLNRAQVPDWVISSNSSVFETANTLAVDSVNQWVYVSGSVEAAAGSTAIMFSAELMPSGDEFYLDNQVTINGEMDTYIAKLSYEGDLLWMYNFGTDKSEEINGMCVGTDFNVYCTGYFEKNMILLGVNDTENIALNKINGADTDKDIFIFSLTSDGEIRWAQSSGGENDDIGFEIESSLDGVAAVGVYKNSNAQLCGETPNQNTSFTDLCLLKYSYSGVPQWFVTAGSDDADVYDTNQSISDSKFGITRHGNKLYVIGDYLGSSLNFYGAANNQVNAHTLTNADDKDDIFLVSLVNTSGAINWTNSIAGTDNSIKGFGITNDCDGLYICAGADLSATNSLTFPSGTILSGGLGNDMFIAGIDMQSGIDTWAVLHTGLGLEQNIPFSLMANGRGDIAMAGKVNDQFSFSTLSPVLFSGDSEAFYAEYSNDGTYLSSTIFGGTGNDIASDIAYDSNGNLFVCGMSADGFSLMNSMIDQNNNSFVANFTSVNISNNVCCTNPPVAGLAEISNSNPCRFEEVTVTLTGFNGDIQWQKSIDGGDSWVSVSGAVLSSHTFIPDESMLVRAMVYVAGCDSQYSSTLTISMSSNELIICPFNFTVDVGDNCDFTIPNYLNQIGLNDCSMSQLTQIPAEGEIVSTGTYPITMMVTSNSEVICSFSLTVVDNSYPTIVCPDNIEANANQDCEYIVPDLTLNSQASDNCEVVISQSPVAGTVIGAGTTDVIITAEDNSGHTSNCIVTIEIFDITPPELLCIGNQDLDRDENCEALLPDYSTLISSSDACTETCTYVQEPSIGTLISENQQVIMTVSDETGNSSVCVFEVILIDNLAPLVNCYNGNQTVTQNTDCEFVLPDYGAILISSDNCQTDLIINQIPAPGESINGSTVVNLTFSDNQNITDCSFTVLPLALIELPEIICPLDQSVSFNDNCSFELADYTSMAVTEQPCNGSVTIQQSPPAGGTYYETVEVTLTSSIQLLNETCSFSVNPIDDTAPTINCLSNQELEMNNDCEFIVPNYASIIEISDNCDQNLIVMQSPSQGTSIDSDTEITISVTDDAGNQSQCVFTLNLNIIVNFELNCENIEVESGPNCSYEVPEYYDVFIPNQDCNIVDWGQSISIGTLLAPEDYNIDFWAIDEQNNQYNCSTTISVIGNSAPQFIICPDEIEINSSPNSCLGVVPNMSDYFTVVDCVGNGDGFVITQTPNELDLIDGNSPITILAEDYIGQTGECIITVNIIDVQSPDIDCASFEAIEYVDWDCNYEVGNYLELIVIDDNCGIIEVTQSPQAGEIRNRDINDVTITATDVNGNMSSCQFEILVLDTIAPVISECYDDGISINAGSSCSSIIWNYSAAIPFFTSDNCDQWVSVSQYPPSGTELYVGNHEIIFTATDSDGNSSTCSSNFIVTENLIPEISEPNTDDFEVFLDGNCFGYVDDYTPFFSVEDLCSDNDSIIITQIPEPGTIVYVDVEIHITATDQSNNSAFTSFTLHVHEAENFSMSTELESVTEYYDTDCSLSSGDYTSYINYISNCGTEVEVIQLPEENGLINGFVDEWDEMVFTLQGVDDHQIIIPYYILDTIRPTFIGFPEEIIIEQGYDCTDSLQDLRSLGFTNDNCSPNNLTINQYPEPGEPLILGPNEVMIEVIDQSDNSSSYLITVILVDNIAPEITSCVDDQIVNTNNSCQFEMEDYSSLLEFEDNCNDADWTITQSPEVGEVLAGNQLVTITVTDVSGNFSQCSFNITVQDNTPPVINCPTEPIEASANEDCQYILEDITSGIEVNDNCSENIDVWMVPEIGSPLELGTNQILVYASDENDNESSCTVIVDVVDISPPYAEVEAIELTLELNEDCEALMPDLSEVFEFYDNCDSDLTFMQSHEPNVFLELGQLSGALSVSDDADNTFILTYTIDVVDNQSPQLSDCPEEQDISVESSCVYYMPDYSDLVEYDDCNSVSVTQNPEALTLQSTSQTVTLTFTDIAGNSSECSFWLNMIDSVPPEITCPENQIVYLLEDCDLSLGSYDELIETSDNCEFDYLSQSPAPDYEIIPGETIQVEINAYDISENTSQCTFSVSFVDEIAPEIECPENIMVSVDPELCGAIVEFDTPLYDDNCPSISFTQATEYNSGDVFPVSSTTLDYQVEDLAGNSATCSFTITVVDDMLPTIICPNPISSCEALVFFDTPEVSDACGIESVFQIDESGYSSGMEFPVGVTLIEYEVFDVNGNSASCSFELEISESITASWSPIPEIVCEDSESIDLTDYINSEYDFFWTGDIIDGIINPTLDTPGDYTITLNVSSGDCQADSSQTITIEPLPVVNLVSSLEVCDLSAELSANISNGNIQWSAPPESIFLSENDVETVFVESSEYGSFDYSLSVVSENGCSVESFINVTYYEAPSTPYAGEDQELHIQTNTNLEGEYLGVGDYEWSIVQGSSSVANPTSLNSNVNNLSIGINEFILSVTNGVCPIETDSVIVLVYGLSIPSGFSPNGDVVNDVFEIKGIENWPNTPLKVFNRWGGLVYENNDYKNQWDGTGVNGVILPDDTYFYIISIGESDYKGYLVIKK